MEHLRYVQPGCIPSLGAGEVGWAWKWPLPQMRYCQAQAFVHSLMRDGLFLILSERVRKNVTSRILEEGRR